MVIEPSRSADAELIEKAGHTEKKIARQNSRGNLFDAVNAVRIRCCSTHQSWSPRRLRRCLSNSKFSEAGMAMSFLEKWIEAPHAGFDPNMIDQITPRFRTHNLQA
jgi:hypothetical protein